MDEDLTADPLALAPVAWNRVVRREFWHAHAPGFSDEAPYEDVIPAHRAVLLAGERATVRGVPGWPAAPTSTCCPAAPATPRGAVATVEGELTELFRSDRWDTPATDRPRAAFRTRFCSYGDRHAAERVVRALIRA